MDNPTRLALVYLLGSIRAAVDAGLQILNGDEPLPWESTPDPVSETPPDTVENEPGGDCLHPPEAIKPMATMGHPGAWLCGACGFFGGMNDGQE